jgi:polyhydroxybutyrate depolymerase
MLACASPAAASRAGIEHTIKAGGIDRTYRVYRPAALDRQTPVPLVVVLHGGFGTVAQAEKSYRWDAEAETEGFVVVYPDGMRRSWNAGGLCCGKAQRDQIDDVGFLTDMIAEVARTENIDPRRVYMTGMSNGAAMAYRYACEGSTPIAAFGTVSGTMTEPCPHPRAVSLMEIHGRDDRNIPIEGGNGTKGVTGISWKPLAETIDLFRRAGECAEPRISASSPVTTSVSTCKTGREVILTTIAGAGHQWPGGRPHASLATVLLHPDPPSTALDATATLWEFFRRHASP